tara:strand:+ start:1870 stop:2043 length:174 start_codon:yes stop_codon:yes gene_type:complete
MRDMCGIDLIKAYFTSEKLLNNLKERLKLTAHNGVVLGSSPSGPTTKVKMYYKNTNY